MRTMQKATSSLGAGVVLAVLVALLAPIGTALAQVAPVPVDLFAVTGTTSLPNGQTVNVWGYNTTNASVSQPGGPPVIVTEGDTVQITLHNQLPESTALLLGGQSMIPDTVGVGAGLPKTYTFQASRPGTYLYGAGLLPNAQHQVAMGLYGALIVRPAGAPTQAYGSSLTAFNDEAVLVLSELDPAVGGTPAAPLNPANFDMRKYAPRYFLINGKAYPNTDPIPSTVGNNVLLRYINAGNQYHSMEVQGTHQTWIALDGSPLDFSRRYVAETIGPGQTADAIVTVPTSTTSQSLAVHDGSLLLHNTSATGSGGMLTFLTAAGTGALDTGPVTTNVAFATGTLTATVADPVTSQSNIAAAEYFMDAVGTDGNGTAMTGSFGTSASATVSASVPAPAGRHIFYVHGQDANGHWGVVSSVLVQGADATGPITKFPTLTPDLTNNAAVAVHATADDSTTGGSNIDVAEYFIGAVGAPGTGTTMTVNQTAPTASLDATIPATTVAALTEGMWPVSIRSHDSAGNWGDPVAINLVIDETAPVTSAVSAAPSPNNGLIGFNASTPAVRVTADLLDAASNVRAAEGFIDAVGTPATGTGFVFSAADGAFDTPHETGISDIPLATIKQLTNGTHTISVRSKDAAGNWGAMATTTLIIDKAAPVVTGVTATPNPLLSATAVTLSASATDVGTPPSVTQAEWFTGADPGIGNATPMTITGTGPWSLSASINVSNWNDGLYTLNVRARDAVGNWSTPVTTVLNVTRPLFYSTFGNTNPPAVAGTADDADIYFWNGTAHSRSTDVSAITNPLPTGANVDGLDRVDATHFYMSFSGDVTAPGLGIVQDEDVVFYNAGTWSVYFDGTANGLGTTGNLDLDAISVAGTTLYFSTFGNTNPPGVGGTADDADIYSWNGTSFARVIDATAITNPLPAAANVDGFVRFDATHFSVSFSADTTTLPVLGAVQDEDVVYYNAGTWSVYFDGTAHGLGTSGNLDVDAFDVP